MKHAPQPTVDIEPIALASLKTSAPWWPFSSWYTAKLIRDKQLGCVRMGRRVFVTKALLQEFIAARVVRP